MKLHEYFVSKYLILQMTPNGSFACSAPWLRGQDRTILSDSLEELYLQNIGENILYLWVEKVREFLVEKSQTSDAADQGTSLKSTTEENYVDDDHEILLGAELSYGLFQNSIVSGYMNDSEATKEDIPTVEHGEPISDRRSTFQAHLAHVVSPLQVKAVLNKLYENKKIAAATHNIYAYRWVPGLNAYSLWCVLSVGYTLRKQIHLYKTAKMMEKPQQEKDFFILCRSWMPVMSW
ncbi:IMPACT isoform X3 [Pelobates cultripes]|uniref:IMPACT isoform X3 n=1 Tax=Pelobates cultripes TaxID=61616 RepID=A0AAD1W5M0_PELCU|nr:IMPACT isoform X3 [Pelobates cultripes]